jgi:hypothetical protein
MAMADFATSRQDTIKRVNPTNPISRILLSWTKKFRLPGMLSN